MTTTGYWFRTPTGHLIRLDGPQLLEEMDGRRFQTWMLDRGWRFIDYSPEPMMDDYLISRNSVEDILADWDKDLAEWHTKVNIPSHITRSYEALGLLNDSEPLQLCDCCRFSSICWSGMDGRKPRPPHEEWGQISLPWIGSRYMDLRILFIGVNPYEAGGLQFYPRLVPEAQEELSKGKTRVNFGVDGYRGTLLFHRMGLYASKIIDTFSYRPTDLNWYDDPEPPAPGEALDSVAFVNSIKCSPVGDRSVPSNPMWENCRYILEKELLALRPFVLVVLGRSQNWHSTITRSLEDVQVLEETETVRIGYGYLNGRKVGLLNVPHPSAPGGAKLSIASDVQKLVRKHRRNLSGDLTRTKAWL